MGAQDVMVTISVLKTVDSGAGWPRAAIAGATKPAAKIMERILTVWGLFGFV